MQNKYKVNMTNLIENIISTNGEWEEKYNQIYDYYLSNYFSIYGLEKFNNELYEWLMRQKKNKNLTENQKNKINKLQNNYKNYVFAKNYAKILKFIKKGYNLTQLRKMDGNLFAWYRNILIKYDELDDDKKQKLSYAKAKLQYNGDNYRLRQNLQLLDQYLEEHGSLENLLIENPELYYYLQGKKQTIKHSDIKDAKLKKVLLTFIKSYEQSIVAEKEKFFEENAQEILSLLAQGETLKSISKKKNKLIVWFYRCKKRTNLSAHQRDILDKISNYPRVTNSLVQRACDRKWLRSYNRVKAYYEEHNFSLTDLYRNDPYLYKWWLRNRNTPDANRKVLMDKFQSIKDKNWDDMFDRVKYKLTQNIELDSKEKLWLKYQKGRKIKLSNQQKEKLEEIHI